MSELAHFGSPICSTGHTHKLWTIQRPLAPEVWYAQPWFLVSAFSMPPQPNCHCTPHDKERQDRLQPYFLLGAMALLCSHSLQSVRSCHFPTPSLTYPLGSRDNMWMTAAWRLPLLSIFMTGECQPPCLWSGLFQPMKTILDWLLPFFLHPSARRAVVEGIVPLPSAKCSMVTHSQNPCIREKFDS